MSYSLFKPYVSCSAGIVCAIFLVLRVQDGHRGGSSAEHGDAYNGNGLAATVMQERQASYMYIMPQEHLSSKDSPEVGRTACIGSPAALLDGI